MDLNRFAPAVILTACVLGFASSAFLKVLEARTAEQCKKHAWPIELNQVQRDFCIGSGYPL